MKEDITDSNKLNLLSVIALGVVIVGAGSSLILTLQAGRNNKSIVLVALFSVWVLLPFIALVAASMVSRRWSLLARVALYFLMIFVTVGTLLGYSGVLIPSGSKHAGVFLIVPLFSWIVMAIAYFIIKFRKEK